MNHHLEAFWQDLRYALRMLRRNLGMTIIAVIILGLGIGANTAIYTLFNAAVVKPLPVREPQRLVLFSDATGEGTSNGDPPAGEWQLFSYSNYKYFHEQSSSFEDLCAFRSGEARLSVLMEGSPAGDAAQLASGHLVSGNFFATLGVEAALGRALAPEDDSPAAAPVAVISYGYWQEKCGGDGSVIGKAVTINDAPFTIVGVMPKGFFGIRVRRSPDYWLPLAFQPRVELQDSFLGDPNTYWLNMLGRLKPEVSLEQARSEVNLLLQQLLKQQVGEQSLEAQRANQAHINLAHGGQGISGIRSYYSDPLKILMAVVALILLIACANVGNLLLSRAVSRRREILIRLALGAGRARLIKQLLTESLLLALMGGLFGVLLARWGASLLLSLVAPTSPLDISPDLSVLAFTAGVSLAAGILFGLAPALRATKADLASGLKEKTSGTAPGRSRFALAPALVVSQVALSVVLLVGAGLFARSLLELRKVDLGFNQDNLLLIDIDPRLAGYKPQELSALYQRLVDRLNGLPNVRSATLASFSPMSGSARTSNISVEGYAAQPGENMVINHLLVGPRYFETLGLALLQGREFQLHDSPSSLRVAVVNESFANHFFQGQNPIGRRFSFGNPFNPKEEIEIIGVVADAKYDNARKTPVRMAYRPILQVQNQSAFMSNLEIRTASDPLAVAQDARSAIAQVDARLPIARVTSLSRQVETTLHQERLMAQLVSFFGLLALVLACVGLYGVMTHAVLRRTSEIGIRMALGAQRLDIFWMVLGEAASQVAVGVVIGIALSLALTRMVSSLLFGVTAYDPMTIALSIAVMLITALLAAYLPARHATKVDPMVALRYE